MNRRGFLGMLVALPLVPVVGLHKHAFEADPTFYGYSCSCGARRGARR